MYNIISKEGIRFILFYLLKLKCNKSQSVRGFYYYTVSIASQNILSVKPISVKGTQFYVFHILTDVLFYLLLVLVNLTHLEQIFIYDFHQFDLTSALSRLVLSI